MPLNLKGAYDASEFEKGPMPIQLRPACLQELLVQI